MRIIQYIGVILFFFLVSCEKDNVEPQKTRTLMVYLAGDNNLSGHMQKNISSMMSAWKKSYNANIVIYFDAPNAAPELYTFRFNGKEVCVMSFGIIITRIMPLIGLVRLP